MGKRIKATIICLTYNHEKYIKSCIEGFLSQKTTFGFEILIHDDASSDNTQDIIKEYADKYPEIIVPILEENNLMSQGINIVENILMPRAKGEYIAFCEGDDYWIDTNKLQMQVDYLENHPEFSACVHNTYFHHCEREGKDFPMFVWNKNTELSFENVLKWSSYGYQTSSLVTRKRFVIKEPPFGYYEYPLALYLVLSGKVYFIAKLMSVYRFRSGETATRANVLSKDKLEKEYQDTIDVLYKVYNYVSEDKKESVLSKIKAYKQMKCKISSMTNDEYIRFYKKNEKISSLKYYIRANHQKVYRIFKDIQMIYLSKIRIL